MTDVKVASSTNMPSTALSCGICHNAYESDFKSQRLPRILWACGHTLCIGCLTPLIKEQKATCPYDSIKMSAPNGIHSFPPNRTLIDLIGDSKAVAAKKETVECSNCKELAAAKHGIIEAQIEIAKHFENAKDKQSAFEWYRKAAKQGHAGAQFHMGMCYEFGTGVVKDEKAAVEWYRKAADQGYDDAEFQLGVCYANGTGVAKDEKIAVKWYRKAADQGHTGAQGNLAECYYLGKGVVKDEKTAVQWFRTVANSENSVGARISALYLGVCYFAGLGVTKDEKAGVEWFRKSANRGYAEAQFKLGICLEIGAGVDKDEKAAVGWFHKAAERHYAQAQHQLGVCFENGIGVSKDEKVAVEWYRKAADQGHDEAKAALARLQAKSYVPH